VRDCLEIALQAPSGANRQQWHWLAVTDPDLRPIRLKIRI
jgi:nitroreductase